MFIVKENFHSGLVSICLSFCHLAGAGLRIEIGGGPRKLMVHPSASLYVFMLSKQGSTTTVGVMGKDSRGLPQATASTVPHKLEASALSPGVHEVLIEMGS